MGKELRPRGRRLSFEMGTVDLMDLYWKWSQRNGKEGNTTGSTPPLIHVDRVQNPYLIFEEKIKK